MNAPKTHVMQWLLAKIQMVLLFVHVIQGTLVMVYTAQVKLYMSCKICS